MDKNILEKYIQDGKSIGEISLIEGRSKSGVKYWLDKYDLKSTAPSRWDTKRSWSDEQLTDAYESSDFMSDILRKLGLTVRPGNYGTIKKHLRRLGLPVEKFAGNKGSVHRGNSNGFKGYLRNDEVFVENSKMARQNVKSRIVKFSLIPYSCSVCSVYEWRDAPLVLVLDHINGVNDDNRLENLRFLCPNCNSQQPTFCRR